jgi:hypothetical protein
MNNKTISSSPNNIPFGVQIAITFAFIGLLAVVGIIACLAGTLIFGYSEALSSFTYKMIDVGLLSLVAIISSLLGALMVKKFFPY